MKFIGTKRTTYEMEPQTRIGIGILSLMAWASMAAAFLGYAQPKAVIILLAVLIIASNVVKGASEV